jgi:hypothetical protein
MRLHCSVGLLVALEEGEELCPLVGRLLAGRPVAAVVKKHEVPIGDVVEDRDRYLEWHHAVLAARG